MSRILNTNNYEKSTEEFGIRCRYRVDALSMFREENK
jgi:hypothetical protein